MANIDGDWKITIHSPMGAQNVTLSLKADGGVLTGSMNGPMGSQTFDNGTVDGDAIAFSTNISQPMPMQIDVSGTVDGDAIKGEVKAGGFGRFPMSGARA